jgi:hypothetical protein
MMSEFTEFLRTNEAKASVLALATNKSKDEKMTDELRDLVQSQFKLTSMPPKITDESISGFVKSYNKLLSTHQKEMLKIFDFDNNVGRGELLLACLSDTIVIGGTSQNYDVDFGDEKIEVKEVKVSGGYGGNFRLGVDSSHLLKGAYDEIAKLYDVAKNYIPEIDNEDFANNVYKKGGIALAKLRDWTIPKKIEIKDIDVTIDNKGYAIHDKVIIGNISDRDFTGNIEKLFQAPKKVKSFEQIERELEKDIAAHDMQYFLFGSIDKGIPLYYKKRIDDIKIESATGHKVKFKIKL